MKEKIKNRVRRFFVVILIGYYQINVSSAQVLNKPSCYTMEADSILRTMHPEMGTLLDFEKTMSASVKTKQPIKVNSKIQNTVGDIYTIPVVFHVIHDGEVIGTGSNISDAQILSQIEVLNEDFARQPGTPGYNTHASGADSRIRFCLAQRKPDGTVFNGINRIDRNIAGFTAPPYVNAYIEGTIKPYTNTQGYIPNQYLNIWVINYNGAGFIAYATFPNFSSSSSISCNSTTTISDGILSDHTVIGRAPFNPKTGFRGHTITHEVGHWLGLYHTWGVSYGVCDPYNDYCFDTPKKNQSSSIKISCIASLNTCVDSPIDLPDMLENYMDYSDDSCQNMFTIDQINRMRTVLEYAPTRKAILTSPACLPPVPDDGGITAILNPGTETCTNNLTPVITIKNYGTNTLNSLQISHTLDGGSTQTLNWSGTLAPQNTTTISLSSVIISSVGNHSLLVYCEAPNGQPDLNTLTDTLLLNFSYTQGAVIPFNETFENAYFPPPGWNIIEESTVDCIRWNKHTGINDKYGNITSTAFNYHFLAGSTLLNTDELISPVLDLTTSATPPTLYFDVAYARRSTTAYEDLNVYISTDCGTTWNPTPVYSKTGNGTLGSDLRTTNPTANIGTYWAPSASQWRTESVSLAAYNNSQVKLKFVSTNRIGNNIFIDNIIIRDRPLISFLTSSTAHTESSVSGTTDCRGYTDISIPMMISEAYTSDVTVNFTLSGTAISPADYMLLTTNLVFPANISTNQNIIIRVYNDKAIEITETIIINYSVSAGAIKNDACLTHTINITDNDSYTITGTIWSENFETSGGTLTTSNGTWTITSPMPGLNSWCVGTNGGMTGTYSAYISDSYSASKLLNYQSFMNTGVRLVSPSINTQGITNLTLSFNYKSNGEINTDIGRLFYATNPAGPYISVVASQASDWWFAPPFPFGSFQFSGVPTATSYTVTLPVACENQANLYLVWRWDNDNNFIAFNPPFCIDNIVLSGTYPLPVQNILSSTQTEYLGPYSKVMFINNGKLMTVINNITSHDYGCTTVSIDRAGTGATAYDVANTANYLCDKTFMVLPSNNDTMGRYDISLYYTAAEVNGWQAATGQSFASANIMKTGGAISNITPATPTANGATNYIGIAATNGNFGASDKYINASFSSGFSGFGAGVPVTLPNNEFILSGYVKEGNNLLKWHSLVSQNYKHIVLEKSVDGNEYTEVHIYPFKNVQANTTYEYIDNNIKNRQYYYRLKAIKGNNEALYSDVILLYNKLPNQTVNVYPNPGKGVFKVIDSGLDRSTSIELYNIFGVKLSTFELSDTKEINISNLEPGVYVLKVYDSNKATALKIVLEK